MSRRPSQPPDNRWVCRTQRGCRLYAPQLMPLRTSLFGLLCLLSLQNRCVCRARELAFRTGSLHHTPPAGSTCASQLLLSLEGPEALDRLRQEFFRPESERWTPFIDGQLLQLLAKGAGQTASKAASAVPPPLPSGAPAAARSRMGNLNCVEFVFAMLVAMPAKTVGTDLPFSLLIGLGQLARHEHNKRRMIRRRQASAVTGGRSDLLLGLPGFSFTEDSRNADTIPPNAPALMRLLSLLDMQCASAAGSHSQPALSHNPVDASPVSPSLDDVGRSEAAWGAFLRASSKPAAEPHSGLDTPQPVRPQGRVDANDIQYLARRREKFRRARSRRTAALIGELVALFTEIDSSATGCISWEAFTAYLISAESMVQGGLDDASSGSSSIQYATKPAWTDTVTRGDALRRTVWVPAANGGRGELWTVEVGGSRVNVFDARMRSCGALDVDNLLVASPALAQHMRSTLHPGEAASVALGMREGALKAVFTESMLAGSDVKDGSTAGKAKPSPEAPKAPKKAASQASVASLVGTPEADARLVVITCVEYVAPMKMLALGHNSSTVSLWKVPDSTPLLALGGSRSGKSMAATSVGGGGHRVPSDSLTPFAAPVEVLSCPSVPHTLVHGYGLLYASFSADASVWVWHLSSRQLIHRIVSHDDVITAMILVPTKPDRIAADAGVGAMHAGGSLPMASGDDEHDEPRDTSTELQTPADDLSAALSQAEARGRAGKTAKARDVAPGSPPSTPSRARQSGSHLTPSVAHRQQGSQKRSFSSGGIPESSAGISVLLGTAQAPSRAAGAQDALSSSAAAGTLDAIARGALITASMDHTIALHSLAPQPPPEAAALAAARRMQAVRTEAGNSKGRAVGPSGGGRMGSVGMLPQTPHAQATYSSSSMLGGVKGGDISKGDFSEDGRLPVGTGGAFLARLPGHQRAVNTLCWVSGATPAGGILLSAGYDLDILAWDVAAFRQCGVLSGHRASVVSVAELPPEPRVATRTRGVASANDDDWLSSDDEDPVDGDRAARAARRTAQRRAPAAHQSGRDAGTARSGHRSLSPTTHSPAPQSRDLTGGPLAFGALAESGRSLSGERSIEAPDSPEAGEAADPSRSHDQQASVLRSTGAAAVSKARHLKQTSQVVVTVLVPRAVSCDITGIFRVWDLTAVVGNASGRATSGTRSSNGVATCLQVFDGARAALTFNPGTNVSGGAEFGTSGVGRMGKSFGASVTAALSVAMSGLNVRVGAVRAAAMVAANMAKGGAVGAVDAAKQVAASFAARGGPSGDPQSEGTITVPSLGFTPRTLTVVGGNAGAGEVLAGGVKLHRYAPLPLLLKDHTPVHALWNKASQTFLVAVDRSLRVYDLWGRLLKLHYNLARSPITTMIMDDRNVNVVLGQQDGTLQVHNFRSGRLLRVTAQPATVTGQPSAQANQVNADPLLHTSAPRAVEEALPMPSYKGGTGQILLQQQRARRQRQRLRDLGSEQPVEQAAGDRFKGRPPPLSSLKPGGLTPQEAKRLSLRYDPADAAPWGGQAGLKLLPTASAGPAPATTPASTQSGFETTFFSKGASGIAAGQPHVREVTGIVYLRASGADTAASTLAEDRGSGARGSTASSLADAKASAAELEQHNRIISCGWDRRLSVCHDDDGASGARNSQLVPSRIAAAAHGSDITCMVHSSALQLLATGGSDGLVRVWDACSLMPEASLLGHGAGITALAFLDFGGSRPLTTAHSEATREQGAGTEQEAAPDEPAVGVQRVKESRNPIWTANNLRLSPYQRSTWQKHGVSMADQAYDAPFHGHVQKETAAAMTSRCEKQLQWAFPLLVVADSMGHVVLWTTRPLAHHLRYRPVMSLRIPTAPPAAQRLVNAGVLLEYFEQCAEGQFLQWSEEQMRDEIRLAGGASQADGVRKGGKGGASAVKSATSALDSSERKARDAAKPLPIAPESTVTVGFSGAHSAICRQLLSAAKDSHAGSAMEAGVTPLRLSSPKRPRAGAARDMSTGLAPMPSAGLAWWGDTYGLGAACQGPEPARPPADRGSTHRHSNIVTCLAVCAAMISGHSDHAESSLAVGSCFAVEAGLGGATQPSEAPQAQPSHQPASPRTESSPERPTSRHASSASLFVSSVRKSTRSLGSLILGGVTAETLDERRSQQEDDLVAGAAAASAQSPSGPQTPHHRLGEAGFGFPARDTAVLPNLRVRCPAVKHSLAVGDESGRLTVLDVDGILHMLHIAPVIGPHHMLPGAPDPTLPPDFLGMPPPPVTHAAGADDDDAASKARRAKRSLRNSVLGKLNGMSWWSAPPHLRADNSAESKTPQRPVPTGTPAAALPSSSLAGELRLRAKGARQRMYPGEVEKMAPHDAGDVEGKVDGNVDHEAHSDTVSIDTDSLDATAQVPVLAAWAGHQDGITSIQAIRQPPSLLSASVDQSVRLFSLAGEALGALEGSKDHLGNVKNSSLCADFPPRPAKYVPPTTQEIVMVHAAVQAELQQLQHMTMPSGPSSTGASHSDAGVRVEETIKAGRSDLRVLDMLKLRPGGLPQGKAVHGWGLAARLLALLQVARFASARHARPAATMDPMGLVTADMINAAAADDGPPRSFRWACRGTPWHWARAGLDLHSSERAAHDKRANKAFVQLVQRKFAWEVQHRLSSAGKRQGGHAALPKVTAKPTTSPSNTFLTAVGLSESTPEQGAGSLLPGGTSVAQFSSAWWKALEKAARGHAPTAADMARWGALHPSSGQNPAAGPSTTAPFKPLPSSPASDDDEGVMNTSRVHDAKASKLLHTAGAASGALYRHIASKAGITAKGALKALQGVVPALSEASDASTSHLQREFYLATDAAEEDEDVRILFLLVGAATADPASSILLAKSSASLAAKSLQGLDAGSRAMQPGQCRALVRQRILAAARRRIGSLQEEAKRFDGLRAMHFSREAAFATFKFAQGELLQREHPKDSDKTSGSVVKSDPPSPPGGGKETSFPVPPSSPIEADLAPETMEHVAGQDMSRMARLEFERDLTRGSEVSHASAGQVSTAGDSGDARPLHGKPRKKKRTDRRSRRRKHAIQGSHPGLYRDAVLSGGGSRDLDSDREVDNVGGVSVLALMGGGAHSAARRQHMLEKAAQAEEVDGDWHTSDEEDDNASMPARVARRHRKRPAPLPLDRKDSFQLAPAVKPQLTALKSSVGTTKSVMFPAVKDDADDSPLERPKQLQHMDHVSTTLRLAASASEGPLRLRDGKPPLHARVTALVRHVAKVTLFSEHELQHDKAIMSQLETMALLELEALAVAGLAGQSEGGGRHPEDMLTASDALKQLSHHSSGHEHDKGTLGDQTNPAARGPSGSAEDLDGDIEAMLRQATRVAAGRPGSRFAKEGVVYPEKAEEEQQLPDEELLVTLFGDDAGSVMMPPSVLARARQSDASKRALASQGGSRRVRGIPQSIAKALPLEVQRELVSLGIAPSVEDVEQAATHHAMRSERDAAEMLAAHLAAAGQVPLEFSYRNLQSELARGHPHDKSGDGGGRTASSHMVSMVASFAQAKQAHAQAEAAAQDAGRHVRMQASLSAPELVQKSLMPDKQTDPDRYIEWLHTAVQRSGGASEHASSAQVAGEHHQRSKQPQSLSPLAAPSEFLVAQLGWEVANHGRRPAAVRLAQRRRAAARERLAQVSAKRRSGKLGGSASETRLAFHSATASAQDAAVAIRNSHAATATGAGTRLRTAEHAGAALAQVRSLLEDATANRDVSPAGRPVSPVKRVVSAAASAARESAQRGTQAPPGGSRVRSTPSPVRFTRTPAHARQLRFSPALRVSKKQEPDQAALTTAASKVASMLPLSPTSPRSEQPQELVTVAMTRMFGSEAGAWLGNTRAPRRGQSQQGRTDSAPSRHAAGAARERQPGHIAEGRVRGGVSHAVSGGSSGDERRTPTVTSVEKAALARSLNRSYAQRQMSHIQQLVRSSSSDHPDSSSLGGAGPGEHVTVDKHTLPQGSLSDLRTTKPVLTPTMEAILSGLVMDRDGLPTPSVRRTTRAKQKRMQAVQRSPMPSDGWQSSAVDIVGLHDASPRTPRESDLASSTGGGTKGLLSTDPLEIARAVQRILTDARAPGDIAKVMPEPVAGTIAALLAPVVLANRRNTVASSKRRGASLPIAPLALSGTESTDSRTRVSMAVQMLQQHVAKLQTRGHASAAQKPGAGFD